MPTKYRLFFLIRFWLSTLTEHIFMDLLIQSYMLAYNLREVSIQRWNLIGIMSKINCRQKKTKDLTKTLFLVLTKKSHSQKKKLNIMMSIENPYFWIIRFSLDVIAVCIICFLLRPLWKLTRTRTVLIIVFSRVIY
jgi:hypothetical protein